MVYVSNYDNKTVSVIDGKTNTVTATIPIRGYPSDVSINPSTNLAYVTDQDNNTMYVLDGKTNKVIAHLKVGEAPINVSVNPSTNMVYVASTGNLSAMTPSTISIIDGKTNSITANVRVGACCQPMSQGNKNFTQCFNARGMTRCENSAGI
jgi:YVTN family beta-propeller protein